MCSMCSMCSMSITPWPPACVRRLPPRMQVRVERGSQPPAPVASHMDDEQEMNDTLGQLLMVMNRLDDEIGEL